MKGLEGGELVLQEEIGRSILEEISIDSTLKKDMYNSSRNLVEAKNE